MKKNYTLILAVVSIVALCGLVACLFGGSGNTTNVSSVDTVEHRGWSLPVDSPIYRPKQYVYIHGKIKAYVKQVDHHSVRDNVNIQDSLWHYHLEAVGGDGSFHFYDVWEPWRLSLNRDVDTVYVKCDCNDVIIREGEKTRRLIQSGIEKCDRLINHSEIK